MAQRLKKAEAVVVADYRGLDVAQMTTLRTKLRQNGSEIQVIKNSLVTLAFAEAGIEAPADLLAGPTAVILFHEDLSGPAKTLRQFAKDTQILAIKGGIMGGQRLSASGVDALAELPTKEELQATLLGVFQAPMRNFVVVTSAPLRNLVNVLNARARGEGHEAAA
jgi:large subunit ribosomal protein L10